MRRRSCNCDGRVGMHSVEQSRCEQPAVDRTVRCRDPDDALMKARHGVDNDERRNAQAIYRAFRACRGRRRTHATGAPVESALGLSEGMAGRVAKRSHDLAGDDRRGDRLCRGIRRVDHRVLDPSIVEFGSTNTRMAVRSFRSHGSGCRPCPAVPGLPRRARDAGKGGRRPVPAGVPALLTGRRTGRSRSVWTRPASRCRRPMRTVPRRTRCRPAGRLRPSRAATGTGTASCPSGATARPSRAR